MTIRDKIRQAEESRKTPEQLEAEARAREEAIENARLAAIAAEEALVKKEAIERARMEAMVEAAELAHNKAAQKAEEKAQKQAIAKEKSEDKAAAKEAARLHKEQEKESKAKAKAEAEVEAEAAAEARAIEQAKEKAEAQARAIVEAEEKARLKAEAQARAIVEAEEKAKLKAEAQARAIAEAEEKTRLKAKAQALAKAESEARVQAAAMAKAEADERVKAEKLEKAKERAEAEAKYQILAHERAEREAKAKEKAKAEALEKVKADAAAHVNAIEHAKLEKGEKIKAAAEAKVKAKAEKEAKAKADKVAGAEKKTKAIAKLEADLEAKAIAKAMADVEEETQAYVNAKVAMKAEAEAYSNRKNKKKNKRLKKDQLSADFESDIRRPKKPKQANLRNSFLYIYSQIRAYVLALYKGRATISSRKIGVLAYSTIVILVIVFLSRVITDRYFQSPSAPLLYENELPPELVVLESKELPEDIVSLVDAETAVADVTSSVEITQPAAPQPVLANWQKNAVASDIPAGYPRLVIVIDDLGMSMAASRKLAKLKSPLTLAFLPYADRLPYQSALVRKQGHELLVHMPMAPKSKTVNPGNNALLAQLDEDEFHKRLNWNLSRFNGFIGINNHMGSRLTEQTLEMQWVMAELKERGLIFLDSVTTNKSVASDEAKKAGVPTLSRNVFIDNVRRKDAILAQLNLAKDMSKRRGLSIAIGHPYSVTLAVLKEWLPTLEAEGVVLTPLSAAISEKYFAESQLPTDVIAASAR